ncbi:MAG: M67 family metallopeptidase [Bryobacter sp.]
MIEINVEAAAIMQQHGESCFPRECCGILLGTDEAGRRLATIAIACRNAYEGDQSDRFAIDPQDQLAAQKKARSLGLDVIGFFHSHPDEGAYFSQTDLKNHWPGYSNVVMSVRAGRFTEAKCFRVADFAQTASEEEELLWPKF